METSFRRLLQGTLAAAFLLPALCVVASQVHLGGGATRGFLVLLAATGAGGVLGTVLVTRAIAHRASALREAGERQAAAVDVLPDRWLALAIAGSAAVGLFLELVVIRWQGTVFKFFDLYKNLGLLACFVGLGLGYATARRRELPLFAVLPLFLLQIGLLLGLKHGLGWRADVFLANPVREQLQMGLPLAQGVAQYAAIYTFMAVTFLLTALTFVPLGRLCGRTMLRRQTLNAYGWNLAGSFAGVVLAFAVAAAWTPPAVWFALGFVVLLPFLRGRAGGLALGAGAAVGALALLSLGGKVGEERVYSPYQLVERGPSRTPGMEGLSNLTVSGKYYQRILDLSAARQADSAAARQMAHHYELPYRLGRLPERVAILGAGTGNDVAAALRAGAQHVDAVEIDPVILRMGELYHPEQPYQDERVQVVLGDARSHLRNTEATYDRVVYGLLDAQTLLASGASVRLDSFVYTVEALQEARARLRPGGLLVLSFAVCSDGQGRKMHRMLEEAFDGRPPVSVRTDIGDVTFIAGAEANPELAALGLADMGFTDTTAHFSDPSLVAEVSTDDWPFLYMQHRVYPLSYLTMLVVVPLISLLLIVPLTRTRSRATFGGPAFMLLGAGFMLIETKGITEAGLTFGNTWHVVGVVILGVLAMAWLANAWVAWRAPRGVTAPYLLLVAALAAGLLVAARGGLPSTFLGRLGTVVLLTAPLFFSGLAFSTLLARAGDVPGAMAGNLFGAMLGGLLEYNAMYFGYRFLYVLAIGIYLLAWAATVFRTAPATALGKLEADASADPGG